MFSTFSTSLNIFSVVNGSLGQCTNGNTYKIEQNSHLFLAIFERRKLLSGAHSVEDWSKRTLKFDGKYTGEEVGPGQVFREAEVGVLRCFRKSWIILSCNRWKVGEMDHVGKEDEFLLDFFFLRATFVLRAYSDGTCSGFAIILEHLEM